MQVLKDISCNAHDRFSEGVLDEKTKQKLQKEEEKIKQDAQEMETRERKESKAAKKQERAM